MNMTYSAPPLRLCFAMAHIEIRNARKFSRAMDKRHTDDALRSANHFHDMARGMLRAKNQGASK